MSLVLNFIVLHTHTHLFLCRDLSYMPTKLMYYFYCSLILCPWSHLFNMLVITPMMLLSAVREFGIQGTTGMFLPVS